MLTLIEFAIVLALKRQMEPQKCVPRADGFKSETINRNVIPLRTIKIDSLDSIKKADVVIRNQRDVRVKLGCQNKWMKKKFKCFAEASFVTKIDVTAFCFFVFGYLVFNFLYFMAYYFT